ncbi:TetR/AcrR family transcriptional regulator [Streptomyces sp. FH025]|uniref:TetR/AcrR family transcriptional regulator n=1 Tax=Streptomyces sp. FH025 TaxID=2815937 RepID=UPI001A9F1195|nr:TetR/AcrR family transcriptional regulator [Streptomyces sp. FH025]MBO1414208.1 TetR/AcrR family transcriptional regulator [Streptomyces sp. FH025]
MGDVTQSRRVRLRAEATSEIKAIALKHLAASGPASISLRAIAREMGMSAGAIYSYFASRDDLITVLIADVHTALANLLEAAHRTARSDDPASRMLAHATAYREWAITHPEEFRLVYGDPIPGYLSPTDGAGHEAAHRLCGVLLGVVGSAWPHMDTRRVGVREGWSDFQPGLVALARDSFPELPPAAVGLCLRFWGRMHGLLALEVYGHLSHQVADPAKLYQSDMLEQIAMLGLSVPQEG